MSDQAFRDLWKDLKKEDDTGVFAISEMVSEVIGNISRVRRKLGMSQRELAKRSGVKQSAIARLETLNAVPQLDTLVKLAYHLDLKITMKEKYDTETTYIFYNGTEYNPSNDNVIKDESITSMSDDMYTEVSEDEKEVIYEN